MTFNEKKPTPNATTLGAISAGTVFKFKGSNTVCMKLPYDGEDFSYLFRHASCQDSFIDSIVVYDENVYVYDEEGDGLDKDYYFNDGADTLKPYVLLATGEIYFSHYDETIYLLEAELTYYVK